LAQLSPNSKSTDIMNKMKNFLFGALLLIIYSGTNLANANSKSTYKSSYSSQDTTKRDTTTKGSKTTPTDTLKTKKPKSK
jgi:hypothetical protein